MRWPSLNPSVSSCLYMITNESLLVAVAALDNGTVSRLLFFRRAMLERMSQFVA